MTDTLTLYTNPMSRGRIAHWMMEEAGQPYKVVYVDYGPPMQAPDYLAINPMGKVPALTHGDTVVTEYAAICAYMADAFPDAGLVPENRGAYYRWLFFGSGPLEAAVINRALGVTVPEDKFAMIGYRDLDRMLDALEAALQKSPYLGGDAFSAVDVATGSQIGWGMQFGSIEKRPVFEEYWARLSSRAAYKSANDADNAAMPKKD